MDMETRTLQRSVAYAVIVLGVGLAFIAAVVPHFMAGYRVLPVVLVTGLLPYLAYGLAVPLLRTRLTALAGIILLGLHAALVISERFVGGADYSDGLIHIGPLVLALATLPLLVIGLSQPWGAEPPARTTETE
ncbi:MAG TPA: hypothetical protein VIR60_01075 [Gammaproteobacteria bacterium]